MDAPPSTFMSSTDGVMKSPPSAKQVESELKPEQEQDSERDWWPLESSPEVLTKLARHWDLPDDYEFVDVLGLDPELLALVPRPVHAVVFLFPDTPSIVEHRNEEGSGIPAAKGQEPLWIPQVGVGHSCGTFAVLHSLAATRLAPALNGFFDECLRLEPSQRTQLLASSPLIKPAHMAVVSAGDSRVRETDWEDADHFLAFVQHRGRIWEMDGNTPRRGPLDRGAASDDLLADAAQVIRHVYLPRAEGSVHFSTIALVGPPGPRGL